MKHAQKGFTLIEIMIVVAIIAILAAIAIPNFISYRKSSQANACCANLKAIVAANEAYAMAHGSYADQVSDLAKTVNGKPGFLKSIPVCPNGGTYDCSKTDATTGARTCECSMNTDTEYKHSID